MEFKRAHPLVQLVYFAGVLAGALLLRHPVFTALSLAGGLLFAGGLCGRRALRFGLALLPLCALFALWYGVFLCHTGATALVRLPSGNALTAQALCRGLQLGGVAAAFLLWLRCASQILTVDKLLALLGPPCPPLALFCTLTLRFGARLRQQARRIALARAGVGRGPGQGGPLRRGQRGLACGSILLTWGAESLLNASSALRSRGVLLPGRSAWAAAPLTRREWGLLFLLFCCLCVTAAGAATGQAMAVYLPRVFLPRITPLSFVFYGGWLLFCLLPPLSQLAAGLRLARALRRM